MPTLISFSTRVFVICLAVVFSAILFSLNAQQTTFRIQYDVAIFDLPGGIVQSPSGNFVFTGTNATLGTTGHLFELNPNGNVNWSKAYSAGGISTQFSDIKNTVGGGYIVTGGTGSGCLLVKTDASGNVTWANRYRVSSSTGSSEYGNKVIQTSDGGYVVAGSATRIDPDGSGPVVRQDSSKMFAMKVNSSGALQWMRVFFYTTSFDDDDYLYDVAEVSDGYVFVGLVTMVAGDGHSDAVILKTDFDGNLIWARRWGNSNSEGAYAVINNGPNEVVISGDDNARAFLLRVTTANTGPSITGTNSLYTTTGFSALGSSLVRTIDGHFTIFGTRIGVIFTPPFLDYSVFVMKTNASTGAVMFSKTYNSGFVSIIPVGLQASDTGYVMNSISATLQGTSYDYGVVKTDKNGSQGSGSSCPEGSPTFSRSNYAPGFNSFTPVVVTTQSVNAITMTVVNINPVTQIICRNIVCNAPPQPTVTVSQNNICPGTQVTISATGGNNVTYRVYTQASGGTSIGTAPLTVSPTTTTTYYVEADDNSNPGCVSTRGSVTVNVLTPASISGGITGNTAVCPGAQTYTVTATGSNISYSWNLSGGGSFTSGQNSSSATVNWSTPGNHTLTVTVSNSCATVTRTLTVNVAENVSGVTANATPNPVCVGGTVNLNGNGTGVTTWTWSGPNNFSASTQNTQVNNILLNGAGVYTLTGSSACGTMTATVNVVVNDLPDNVQAVANPNPACVGNTVTLSGSATNATAWSWSGPNNFSANTQNASVPNIQVNGAGTYTFTATNSCGFRLATVNVVVNEAPTNVTAIATPNPVCPGGSVTLSGSANGAVSFSWSGPNNFSAAQLNETINNFQQNQVGTYTLYAVNACGTSQANVSVSISGGPVNVTASANLTNICAQATLQLFGNSPNATLYSWTGPNGFTSSLQNPVINNVSLADSGTYVLTAINDCGNSTASVTIDVDTLIDNMNISVLPDDTLCTGGQINLTATGNNVNNWSWIGPAGFSSSQQNVVISNATVTNSGTYTVTGTNACGSVSENVFVWVNTIPAAPATITGINSLCADTATYSINPITHADGYNWSLSGGGSIISGQGTSSVTVVWTGPAGNYVVSVASFNNCGLSVATTLNVTLLPSAPATPGIISGNTVVCPGIEEYSILPVANATSYNWTVSGGVLASGQGTNSITVSWTTAGGPYTVSVLASNVCGQSESSTIQVTVNPAPTAPDITGNNQTICEGESITLIASGSSGGTVVYTYYDAPTGGNIIGISPLTVYPANTTIYYLEVTNEYGCSHGSGRIPVTVYVNKAPSDPVVAAGGATICYESSVTLTATATPEGTVITWWDAPVNGNLLATGSSYTTGTITQNTVFYVQATGSNGCKNLNGRSTAIITVIPLPEVSLTSDKFGNAVFPGEVITFTASPSTYDSYQFFINNTTVQNSSEYQYATSKLNDKDTVSVIAVNDGCESEKESIIVKILDYPNAFTPNGDSKNDIFLPGYDLTILNRWGQELYKGTNGWDGTYNGKKVSPGTYFYILTLKDITDRENVVKGSVMVVLE